MRTYVVMYSPEARLDIKDIYAYIAYKLQEKIVAEKQVRRIRNAIKDLDYFPLKYEVFKGQSNDDRNIHKCRSITTLCFIQWTKAWVL